MEDIGFIYMTSPISRPDIKRIVQSLIYNEKRSISYMCVCVCLYICVMRGQVKESSLRTANI